MPCAENRTDETPVLSELEFYQGKAETAKENTKHGLSDGRFHGGECLGGGLEGVGSVWEWIVLLSGVISRCPSGRVTCERRPGGDEYLLIQSGWNSFLILNVV